MSEIEAWNIARSGKVSIMERRKRIISQMYGRNYIQAENAKNIPLDETVIGAPKIESPTITELKSSEQI